MEEGRLPNKVMKWCPSGKNRGRPKVAWAEGIRGLLGEKGLIEEDWNDRDNWNKRAQEDVETSNNLLNNHLLSTQAADGCRETLVHTSKSSLGHHN